MSVDYWVISGYGKKLTNQDLDSIVEFIVSTGIEGDAGEVKGDIEYYLSEALLEDGVCIQQGGNYYINDGIEHYIKIKGSTPEELIENRPKAIEQLSSMGVKTKVEDFGFYEVSCVS